ncbi:MAG: response regulator [Gammaproteobacteria bacterium]|nr:response regulator [Gammaproteobacteria bacterium]
MDENRRILIIDDDKGIRETYQEIFTPRTESDMLLKGMALFDSTPDESAKSSEISNLTYQVTLTEDGNQGVKAVQTSLSKSLPYAVAFIDMKMPGMNGAETSREIWEICPGIKIVIVTAYSEYAPEDIIQVTGRDDIFYLRKPFNHEEILQFARALTNEWNLEKQRTALGRALKKINKNLETKVKKQASMIVQADKMASIGILAAGVAHEINNPIAFVNSNLSAIKEYTQKILLLNREYESLLSHASDNKSREERKMLSKLDKFKSENQTDFIMEELQSIADESLDGIGRIKTIVKNLKNFSHIDEAQFKDIDINAEIDNTLKIIWNELKYKVKIVKRYGSLPKVRCYPQKISQVFMNLLINAGQAIDKKGTIGIATRIFNSDKKPKDQFVQIKIADTGCGIPKANLSKLFDPFFTTKPVGEGTGLGLSIVYEIIQAHDGWIQATSDPGKGSCFTIRLPMTEKE